jgi:hypothetical protein
MRNTTLLLATLILLAVAGTASAVECSNCNAPCEGPNGPGVECNYDGSGSYGQCTSRLGCTGCKGWFAQQCIWFAELAPAEPEPLLGVQRVTSVVVRHDPKPLEQQPYQIALSR